MKSIEERYMMKLKKLLKKPTLYLEILAAAAVIRLIAECFRFRILPDGLFIPLVLILLILWGISFVLIFKRKKREKIIASILCVGLTIIGFGGSYYLHTANGFLDAITDHHNMEKRTVSVYALNTTGYKGQKDIDGLSIAISKTNARTYVNEALEKLKNKGVQFEVKEYDSTIEMVHNFRGQAVDLMMIDQSLLTIIEDFEDQADILDSIHSIYDYEYYVESANTATSVDISNEPFNVLISGSDSRADIDETARSDVNLIMTVNPSTHSILLTSVPRDYYVETVCDASMGCANGKKDKLTHTGLHGIETTEKTLEEVFGIEINYNVKVSFSTLTRLVDVLGGITVDNPNEFEAGGNTFEKGNITLNGEQALSYVRERYSFATGDRERGRNQMRVLSAIIDKIASPSVLGNYVDIMNTMKDSFQTNMPIEDIRTLAREQLQYGKRWQIYRNSVDGTGSTEFCYELGNEASVLIPDEETISKAKLNVEAVTMGEPAPYSY